MTPELKKKKQHELRQKLISLKEFAHKIEVAETFDLQQLMEQMVETYPDQIWECVDKGKAMIPDQNRDFYVCSTLKREPLTPKIIKNQFFWCFECPRPYLNFTVFKYHRKADELELIWNLPDKETLNHYWRNRHLATPEDYTILKYVIAYKDGSLYKRMQELNKEVPEKPSLIVHDMSVFN